ncbi:hypothetical protein IQ06DRAFT_278693 [Phaeosphaeriaceae sp. SRC1lsM3a]|nr:hypothetical protein IQ06DRAFT_278693 [Stagonospora sp. SRC1lsM3a]
MSVVNEPPSPSRLPSHKFKPYNVDANIQSTMYDVPSELSPTQLEAKHILQHLLHKLQQPDSRHAARYSAWIARHPHLPDLCLRCIRSQIWTFLSGRWSLDALKAVGGDLKHSGAGIYFDGVLGLDRRVRMYIGQAGSIRTRVAQHLNFRHRRDNPSLHYHAMQKSIYNAIGVVALIPAQSMGNHALPGMDCQDLLLNVLEMWMCLAFRSLPLQTLDEWLPDDGGVKKGRKSGLEGEFGGLNVALPLDQGEKQREWVDLSEDEDPLVREYVNLGKSPEVKREEEDRAKRRIEYVERAKSYNRHWTQTDTYPSQLTGTVLAVTMIFLVGTALWRGGPPGRWR